MSNSNKIQWYKTTGPEILGRRKTIISSDDKDLVLSNLVLFGDIDAYEQSFDDMGHNWHSYGAILGAKIQFAKFSDESKASIKRKFYDDIEYIMERNALEENPLFIQSVPQSGIKDTDILSIECDDEWGLFIRIYRQGESSSYIDLKSDDDPVCELLWKVDRRSLSIN